MEPTQKLELKIIALKEGFKTKIASTLEEYEDRIADLRLEITEQQQTVDGLVAQNNQQQDTIMALEAKIAELENHGDVQEEDSEASAS